jgi:hypothetical protein
MTRSHVFQKDGMAKFTSPKMDDLNEGADNPDEEPVSRVTKLAPASVTLSAEQFQQLLQAATGGGSSAGLADAITQGMRESREPIPENKVTDGISAFNPLGDRLYPRAGLLKCDVFWGAIDDKDRDKIHRTREMEVDDLTLWEILALNMLEPTEQVIKRYDKAAMHVKVEAKTHATTGKLTQLVIAFPLAIIGKGGANRNMVPDMTEIVFQLTGHDFRPATATSHEFLKEAHRLHKAGRYEYPTAVTA